MLRKYQPLSILLICLFPLCTVAQTYFNITTLVGQQTVGGETVTVSTVGSPASQTSCGISPYYIQQGGYKYAFSNSVFKLRLHFIAINYDDTVRMSINGSPYTITTANIANYPNSCLSGPLSAFIYNGAIVGIGSGLYGVQFDLTTNYGIDTFFIYNSVFSSGWVYDFAFADPCPGHVIASATHDSLCVGDSLHLFSNVTSVTNTATYSWTGPGFSSSSPNPYIANVSTAASGTYTVVVYDTGTCTYSSSVQVVVSTPLSSVSATSNSPLCPGDTLKLFSSSLSNTLYSWSGPGSFTSTAQDTIISPFLSADTGTYTITASNSCSTVSATTHVSSNKPGIPYISYATPVCTGHTLTLAANSSTSGVTYQWYGPAFFSSASQSPNIPNITLLNSGTYTVTATHLGCSTSDTLSINVNVSPVVPVVGSNSPLCAGDTIKLTAIDTSSGITYSWTGPGPYTSSSQNPHILNAVPANSGTYTAKVTVTSSGCSSTATTSVTVNPLVAAPTIHINASPGDTICNGSNLILTATSANAYSPVYQWRLNGASISGANSTVYSTTAVNNGDIFTCIVSSTAVCQAIDTAISNAHHLSVITIAPPLTTLTVFPPTYTNGISVTFTGHVPPGDTGLSYSWKKNGVIIPGAHNIVYATSNLTAHDTICLIVHASAQCTVPDSSIICTGLVLGVNNMPAYYSDIQLFPNPNSGSFSLYGQINEVKAADLEVLNMMGQLVYNSSLNTINGYLDHKISLNDPVPGVYFVKLSWAGGSFVRRIVIY